jgi:TPR repeat protein
VSAVVDISPPGVPNAFPLSPTAAATSTATASSNISNGGGGGGGGGGGSRRDAARELYEAGRHAELEGELARARACYLRSSALGHPAAVFLAGRMLEMGIGGPPLLQRVGLSLLLS